MISVFCLRRPGEPPPEGLVVPGGEPVRLVEEGPLGAWICDGPMPPGLDGARAHDAVVRRALRSATPLPARFGTVFSSERELRASLREREAELVAGLERVAGAVEMGIRVRWVAGEPDEPPPAPARTGSGGRAYLEGRRRDLEAREALRSRAEVLLDRLELRVAPEPLAAVRKVLPERGVAGVMAHLVHRQEVGSYRTRVEDARPAFPQVDLRLSGPWAPYSFV